MTRVKVDEKVLKWALDRSGKRVSQLKKGQLKKLDEWLEGKQNPTLKQLEKLSRATLTPLGYFMLPEPPEEQLPIPDFRTLPDEDLRTPSPELMKTIHMMQRRQNWLREYRQDMGRGPLLFVDSLDAAEDDPGEAASKVRRVLCLEKLRAQTLGSWNDARRFLKEAMEDVGITVVFNSVVGNNTHRKLNTDEFRGFVLLDEYAPLVFVNSADYKAAQIFTLAHEMAHIVFGVSSIFDLRNLQPSDSTVEKTCDKAAAEFLVPSDQLIQSWNGVKDASNAFNELARQFKVSELVAARRALDLDLISRDEFLAFYYDYEDRTDETTRSSEGGPSFYTLQDYRVGAPFASVVNRAVREGSLLYSEAYELTGLRGKTFDEYMRRIQS